MAEILELEGLTKKIGLEDLNLGTGATGDTYTAPTYDGGSQTLTKFPDPRDSGHSKIKGVWYVSNDAAITDHSNALTAGSLAWVLAQVGSNSCMVVLPANRTYTISNNLTVDANTTLLVMPGAVLSIAATKTLTLNGKMYCMDRSDPIAGSGTLYIPTGGYTDKNNLKVVNAGETVSLAVDVVIAETNTDYTLDLQVPTPWMQGKRLLIINNKSSCKTYVTGSSGGMVMGTVTLSARYEAVEFVAQGTSWFLCHHFYFQDNEEVDNFIVNGSMNIWQRGTSFNSGTTPANNDDTYLADRWILLSDGNNTVDVTRETPAAPIDTKYVMRSTVVTGSRRWGFLQILISADSFRYRNKFFSARAIIKGSGISKARLLVLGWGGTIDAPTSDCVSSWGSAGNNPTMGADWTILASVEVSISIGYVNANIEGISGFTTWNNLAVLIIADDSDAIAGDYMEITSVGLCPAASIQPFRSRTYGEELALCQRYYEVIGGENTLFPRLTGYGAAGTYDMVSIPFQVEKRGSPTVTKLGTWTVNNCAQPTFGNATTRGMTMGAQVTALGSFYFYPDSTDDKVTIESEL